MINLLFTEIYTQKKIAFFIPIIMLPLFYSIGDEILGNDMLSTMIFSLTIGFISYFLTSYSNSNTGETEKLQYRLLLSLPVSRKILIISKYLMVCIWWLIPYIWLILVLTLLKYVLKFPIEQPIFNWQVTLLSFCSAYFMNSIFFPIYFKYGYKTANIIGIMVFFLISNVSGKIKHLDKNNFFVAFMFDYPLISFASLTLVFVLITFFVSLTIFNKTDY